MRRKYRRKNKRTAGRILLTAAVFALVSAAMTISGTILPGAVSEAYAGTWRQTDSGWYYREAGKNVTGWKRIADETGARHWYYFGEDGRLVRNADTPDGFRVNGDGVFAGISQKGVEQAFAAAEKAKEAAQQAYERNYYAELRAKAAEVKTIQVCIQDFVPIFVRHGRERGIGADASIRDNAIINTILGNVLF